MVLQFQLVVIDFGTAEFYHPAREYNVRFSGRYIKQPERLLAYQVHYCTAVWLIKVFFVQHLISECWVTSGFLQQCSHQYRQLKLKFSSFWSSFDIKTCAKLSAKSRHKCPTSSNMSANSTLNCSHCYRCTITHWICGV